MEKQEPEIRALLKLVKDLFVVDAIYRPSPERVSLSMTFRYDHDRSLALIKDRLTTAGYTHEVDRQEDSIVLTVDPRPRRRIPRLNIIMFLLTVASVYFFPVYARQLPGDFSDELDRTFAAFARGEGIEFTLALISMLLVHEMGHFLAGMRRQIVTSWPYFIPAPSFIGTFGAVIKSKSPFWNKRDLLEVGAAGPIAGWIVAVGWLIYGLSNSQLIPQEAFSPGQLSFTLQGESILMRFLTLSIIGPETPGHFYALSEAAFAGWVALIVTAINMLPMGQMDGGHILYGLVGKVQHQLAKLAIAGLILLGFLSPMWWVIGALTFVVGIKHPPTLNDSRPPSRTSKVMGWIALVIFLLSFTPAPFALP